MTILRMLLAASSLLALSPLGAATAFAETAPCRPWCVYYGGRDGGGGTNCGFVSYEQCMWTAQGSDICMPNGFCPPQSGANRGPPGYNGQGDRRRR